jgi:hypothetical protein
MPAVAIDPIRHGAGLAAVRAFGEKIHAGAVDSEAPAGGRVGVRPFFL